MGTLYLHIGTPKTVTSSIQNFLYSNNEHLKEQGFFYPDFGYRYPKIKKYRNAHFLVHRENCKSCTKEEREKIRKTEDERFYEGLDKVKELMSIYPNIILSDENLWNGYKKRKNFWEILTVALKERKINLKIIVYLRRQDLLIESYWLQRVKGTSCKMNFHEYISSGKYKEFELNYYKRLQKIAKFVGKENIITRVYEKQQWEDAENTLIGDFFQSIGIEMNAKFMNPNFIRNTRLSGGCLEVKRILNQTTYVQEQNDAIVRDLKTIQNEIGTSNCKYFTYKEQLTFLQQYEKSNTAVAKIFLNHKDGILFRDEIPQNEQEAIETYSSEDLVLICGKMLELQNKAAETKLQAMKEHFTYTKRPFIQKITSKLYHTFIDHA